MQPAVGDAVLHHRGGSLVGGADAVAEEAGLRKHLERLGER